jgi:hypothetical protein
MEHPLEEKNFRRSSNVYVHMGSSNSVLLYDKVFMTYPPFKVLMRGGCKTLWIATIGQ